MKRLWPLTVLLLLALPSFAQEGDEAAPTDDAPQEEKLAPPQGEGAPSEEPAPDSSEASPSTEAPADEGAKPEPETTDEAPSKEEPIISVKAVSAPAEEGDENDVAPMVEKKKVVPTATIMKAPKKGAHGTVKKSSKGKTIAKGKSGDKSSSVVKTKAPVVAADAAPPPPLIPAVPLTPITPRNP